MSDESTPPCCSHFARTKERHIFVMGNLRFVGQPKYDQGPPHITHSLCGEDQYVLFGEYTWTHDDYARYAKAHFPELNERSSISTTK